MTTEALESAKDQLGDAAGAVREAAGSGVDGAQELAASISKATAEHASDALAGSEQMARDGAAAVRQHPGRGLAAVGILLLLLAGLAAVRRAMQSRVPLSPAPRPTVPVWVRTVRSCCLTAGRLSSGSVAQRTVRSCCSSTGARTPGGRPAPVRLRLLTSGYGCCA